MLPRIRYTHASVIKRRRWQRVERKEQPIRTQYAKDALGVCPLVKRIWTPSWTLWSGGICFLWLLVLCWILDDARYTRWSYFFRVIGANSIVAYVMSWTIESWVGQAIERHFGFAIRGLVPEAYRTFVLGWLILLVFWLILDWLFRRKIFVRI